MYACIRIRTPLSRCLSAFLVVLFAVNVLASCSFAPAAPPSVPTAPVPRPTTAMPIVSAFDSVATATATMTAPTTAPTMPPVPTVSAFPATIAATPALLPTPTTPPAMLPSPTMAAPASPAPVASTLTPTSAMRVRPTVPPASRSPRATATTSATYGTGTNAGVSEGVRVTGADRWQSAGFTGKGVKVGIIDSSFNGYRRFLPGATVTTRSFRRDGKVENASDADGYHGTACAEIIHEMAPDAALYLTVEDQEVTSRSEQIFADEIDWLIGNGVTIISSSVGQDGGVPHDGTSGYDRIVDRARARGVFFVFAAGNSGSGDFTSDEAEGHYAATFTDADRDGFHDFGGANELTIHLFRDDVILDLNWDDWQMPHSTYGLYLYDATGNEVARATDRVGPGSVPTQEIANRFKRGTYTLRIRNLTPNVRPVRLDLYFSGAQFAEITSAGSITVPADARGAVAVGESDWKTDAVFPGSSQGPTLDGRTKPELVAPSCVTSAVYKATADDVFCGTSAAAPHLAGAAALVRQANPLFTPDDLLAFFQTNAKHLTGAGADPNTGGAGRLDLGIPPK